MSRLILAGAALTLACAASASNGPFPGSHGVEDVTGLSWDPEAGILHVATGSGRAFALSGPEFEGAARARLSETSLDFGGVDLGNEAVNSSLLSNPGSLAVEISTIGEPGADFFRIASEQGCPQPPFQLGSGQSCELSYRFEPTSPGATDTSLSITSDSIDGDLELSLSGTGLQAVLALSTGQLDFGAVTMDAIPVTRELTLTNTGNTDLAINSVESPAAPFAGPTEASDCAEPPLVLAPESSCSLVYEFAPEQPGTFAQGLAIGSSAGTRAFSLLAQALPPSSGAPFVSIEPSRVVFDIVAPGTVLDSELILLEHLGGDPLEIGDIVVVQQSGGQLQVPGDSDFCSQRSLSPGQSCAFRVRLIPDQTVPGPLAEVEIESNAADAPLRITVVGSQGALFRDRFEAIMD
ncbi:MAG: choice-of-anchor D domain-containing protein [Wenzhouxiangella sp.]|nr:MAG: choice-of-anchor D domain-containing protein [Wenzhouxiangella sp.]